MRKAIEDAACSSGVTDLFMPAGPGELVSDVVARSRQLNRSGATPSRSAARIRTCRVKCVAAQIMEGLGHVCV